MNVVLCTETLEHVLETRRFLAEAARCLTPGGTLLLTIPFAARWHFIPYDYWRFTPSSLNHRADGNRLSQRSRLRPRKCCHGRVLQGDDTSPAAVDATNRIKAAGLLLRLVGLLFLPLFLPLAVVANLSLVVTEAMIVSAIPCWRFAGIIRDSAVVLALSTAVTELLSGAWI